MTLGANYSTYRRYREGTTLASDVAGYLAARAADPRGMAVRGLAGHRDNAVRHPELFRQVRDSFIVLNVIAMVCFVLYPLAPPRMLPTAGFVDTAA